MVIMDASMSSNVCRAIYTKDFGKGSFVGSNARRVYHACNLFHGAKHPPVKLAFYPGFQELTVFLAISWLALWVGPTVKRKTGKSLVSQVRDMTRLWFHDGIDPPSYYAFDFYKDGRAEDAPHYLTRFETKNGLLYALNSQRSNPYPISEMNSKTLFAECCAEAGIPHPQTLALVSGGQVEMRCRSTELEVDLFCKRQRGMGATGSFTYRYMSPGTYIDGNGREVNLAAVLKELKCHSMKHPLLVQAWLRNHSNIADLALDSLLTIRVVTVIDERGKPEITLAMLRLLAKLEPQWKYLPDEEYAAPIDLSTGELGLFTGDNLRTSHLRYENHLVTGAKIKGRILEEWPTIGDAALAAHAAFPHRTVVGWDIALTDAGPIVLEGNTNLDVMFLQRVHNAPAAQSRFGELMNFHLELLSRSWGPPSSSMACDSQPSGKMGKYSKSTTGVPLNIVQ